MSPRRESSRLPRITITTRHKSPPQKRAPDHDRRETAEHHRRAVSLSLSGAAVVLTPDLSSGVVAPPFAMATGRFAARMRPCCQRRRRPHPGGDDLEDHRWALCE